MKLTISMKTPDCLDRAINEWLDDAGYSDVDDIDVFERRLELNIPNDGGKPTCQVQTTY